MYIPKFAPRSTAWAGMSPEAQADEFQAYDGYTKWLGEKGWYRSGEPLESSTTATQVRLRDGKVLTTDGPFMETKEQLGGFYLIDVKDLDEAIRWASKIPAARLGCVEVRPVWEANE